MLQTYILTVLAPLFGGGNALINSELSDNEFFSKDYTTVLKGLCALIVIYVHINKDFSNPLQDAIGSFAYICVTLFFLVSAYGMMKSVEQKSDIYLKYFWRNRLVSLLIPCLMVNIVSFGINVINECKSDFSVLYHLNSYVAVLLQWCLLFYVVEWFRLKWFKECKLLTDFILIAGVVISSLYNYFFIDAEVSAQSGWCFERMGLVYGILLYRYFDDFVAWMNKNRWTKVSVLVILGGFSELAYLKFKLVYFYGAYLLKIILGLILLVLIFTSTSNRRFSNKINLWLGNISYEVYLSHGLVMGALYVWLHADVNSGFFIFLTVMVTLVLSSCIHFMAKPLVNSLRSK